MMRDIVLYSLDMLYTTSPTVFKFYPELVGANNQGETK